MKMLFEILRFFFRSVEFGILLSGIFAELVYSAELQELMSSVRLDNKGLEKVLVIPSALCAWTFLSGRNLLFPKKDSFNILQKWPDFWKLKAAFYAALAWNVIFAAISAIAWIITDWENPSSVAWISLVVSVIGAAICSFGVYIAQMTVDEVIVQYKNKEL